MDGEPAGADGGDVAHAACHGLRALVVDGTGIPGNVDVDYVLPAEDMSDPVARSAAMTTAAREQLGLVLEERRVPMPLLVIDRIERPSAN